MTDVAGGLITLEYAKTGLGWTDDNTARDADLTAYIQAATPVIESLVGPVLQQTKTLMLDGGKSGVLLPARIADAAAVIAVRVDGGAWSGYVVNAESGVIYAGPTWAGIRFPPGIRNVEVDVTVGYASADSGTIVLGPPTVTSRNLFPDPSIATAGTTVVLRQNVVCNPSMETHATLWTVVLASTISRTTAQAHRGAASLQVVTAGTTAGEGVYSSVYTIPGMYPNRTYAASIWVLAPVGANMEALCNTTGSGGSVPIVQFTGTGAWQLVTMPNNRANSGLYPYTLVRTRGTAQAITFYVDEAIIELDVATPGPYFDGATQATPDPDFSTRWTGPANASASELTSVLVPGVVTTDCVAIRSGIWAADGNMSMRTIPTGPTPTITVANIPGANTMLATRRDPGDVISEVRENINGPAVLRPSAVQNTWYDQLGIFAGDYIDAWYDGDTAPRLGRTYAWEGAVNASASVETYQPNVFVPGAPNVPEGLKLATRELVRYWVQIGKQAPAGGQLNMLPDSSADPIDPYAIPRRVRQLCAPYAGGGFA